MLLGPAASASKNKARHAGAKSEFVCLCMAAKAGADEKVGCAHHTCCVDRSCGQDYLMLVAYVFSQQGFSIGTGHEAVTWC